MSVLSARGRVAALHRSRTPDDPEYIAARRDLAAEKLAAYVERVVADAPPLTDAQLERVTAILRPTLRPAAGGGRVAG